MTFSKSLYVPPYKSSQATIWSPESKRSIMVDVAAIPDANACPEPPFSRSDIHSSKAFLVGFELLEYHNLYVHQDHLVHM